MRILGIILAGIGCLTLLASGLTFVHYGLRDQLFGWLLFVGLVSVPLIVGGTWMIALRDTRTTKQMILPTSGTKSVPTRSHVRRLLDFELIRLNHVSWSLLCALLGLVYGLWALWTAWHSEFPERARNLLVHMAATVVLFAGATLLLVTINLWAVGTLVRYGPRCEEQAKHARQRRWLSTLFVTALACCPLWISGRAWLLSVAGVDVNRAQ